MNQAPRIRTFIAIDLEETARDFLRRISSDLQRQGADVGWVKNSNIHLTLKFLGDITEDSLLIINKELQTVFQTQEPLHLRIGGPGVFPNYDRPRIIWIGIHDNSDRLLNLFNTIEAALSKLGFPKEKRRFSPHLTLGRVRSNKGKEKLIKAIKDQADLAGPDLRAHEAILFKSDLKPSGSVYTPLCKFQFGLA